MEKVGNRRIALHVHFLHPSTGRSSRSKSCRVVMTKVYPNCPKGGFLPSSITDVNEPEILTVWRKSLLFNCSSFIIFDSKGNLLFRADNYSSSSRTEILLIDTAGKPLFTG